MPRLKVFIITVVIYLITIPVYAQFTSQQAINLVLNQLLSSELDQVDVYMIDIAQSSQDTVFLGNNETILLPYSSNWVFFVDDDPFANWAHNCRFIFVDEATGNYQIINNDFFPEDWTTAYISVSAVQHLTPDALPVNNNANINGLAPNPNLYAVIINSDDNTRFWNDVSAIYCTLLDVYGYTKENFFEHRDYLLSLLPGKKSDNSYKDIYREVTGELVLNAPNPFSRKTKIWYRLKEESSVQLFVYNASGQMLKTIKEGIKGEGDHYVDIDANGMENGIYFYSISLNGITTDTRKMTILK